jgi:type II secretory pathway component PulF
VSSTEKKSSLNGASSMSGAKTGAAADSAKKNKTKLPVVPASGYALNRGKSVFSKIRAEFYEDLAESLDDSAVLVTELQKHLTRAQKKRSALAGLYALWLRRMDTMTFTNAMKGTVPAMDSLVLQASESSGNLPQGLRFLTFSVRAVAKIRGAIMGAITMPVIVGSMIVGMLFGFGKFMVPILTAIVPVNHWPSMGRFMYTLSSAVMNYGLPLFVLGAAAVSAFAWALPNWSGPVRKKFDNVMPFSVYRDYNSAVMLVSLSGLMQSGASLVGSLKSMKASSPPWLAWHIGQVLHKLDREAASPAKAFNTGVLPEDIYERVVDYGERSGFQVALKKIGGQALEKLDKSVQAKAKLLNSILLFISGTMMALIIGSVMLTAQEAKQQMGAKQSQR